MKYHLNCALLTLLCLVGGTACSSAYIKTIDQHGNPIEGVRVKSNYNPSNAFLTRSKTTTSYTNKKGIAKLPVGAMFLITSMQKEGYQFEYVKQFKRQFGHDILGSSASRFSKRKPLVIHGWQQGKLPELSYASGRASFTEQMGSCTLKLIKPNKANGLTEPITFTIDVNTTYRKDEEAGSRNPDQLWRTDTWSATLKMNQAKVQLTEDLYLNSAPMQGYADYLSIGPYPVAHEKHKTFYFKGVDFYGGLHIFIEAMRTTKSHLDEQARPRSKHRLYYQFWFNFDGSTNITRSVKNTTRTQTSLGGRFDNCVSL